MSARLSAIPAPAADVQSLQRTTSALRQNLEFITGQRAVKIRALPPNASISTIIACQNEIIARLQGQGSVGPVALADGTTIPGMYSVPPAYTNPEAIGGVGFDEAVFNQALSDAVAPIIGTIQDLDGRVDTLSESITGGGNMLPNAAFEIDASGWALGWEQVAADNDGTLSRDLGGSASRVVGSHNIGLTRSGTPTGIRDFGHTEKIVVEPGKRYCASGWLACNRCTADVFIAWQDANGNYISDAHSGAVTGAVQGGTSLSGWQRAYVFATAPSNARTLTFNVRQHPTGEATPYVWLCHPMLEEARSGQVYPSPWAMSSAGIYTAVKTVSDAAGANASAITQVNARLESGGDIKQAIVQVQYQASATAENVSGSWGVLIDANGKLTGIKLLNNGQTGTLAINADEVLIDGSVKASKLSAGSVSATALQAGAVVAGKIAVDNLAVISGNLGTVTTGLLRNATDTTRINLNETGSGELLRVNGVTRIWADGRTNWANCITPGGLYKAVNQIVFRVEASDDGEGGYNYASVNGFSFEWDTGILYDATTDPYGSDFSAVVFGWNATMFEAWDGWKLGPADVTFEVRRLQPVPMRPGQSWGGMTVRFMITGRLSADPYLLHYVTPDWWLRIDGLSLNVFRRT